MAQHKPTMGQKAGKQAGAPSRGKAAEKVGKSAKEAKKAAKENAKKAAEEAKKAAKENAKKAAEEAKKAAKEAKKAAEGAHKAAEAKRKAEEKAEKKLPWRFAIHNKATADLLQELKRTKKGLFGDSEKRLMKDAMEKLDLTHGQAMGGETLLAYAALPEVAQKLEKRRKPKAGKGEKGAKPQPALTKKPPVVSATLSPDLSGRTRRIGAVMEELKELEAREELVKSRRKEAGRAIARPFKMVGGAVGSVVSFLLGKLAKVAFVIVSTLVSIPINLGQLIMRLIGGVLAGVYMRVGKFSPFGWKKKVNRLIIYSGVDKTQEEITGITIVDGAVLAVLMALAGFFLFGWDIWLIGIMAVSCFGIAWVVAYSLLTLMADKRSDEVEATLPDVLQIVSANISAGMTPYNALWVSARKEFGALAEEIKIAQKETLGGKSFTEALTDMGTRVRSNVLQRTLRLIVQGMKAGGELPNILQGIGSDIRQMRLLQKEMAASTMSYTLFILFGMVLGAPLLFSVSIQFVDVMNKFQPEGIDKNLMATQAGPMSSSMQGFSVLSLGNKGCPRDFDGDGIPDAWEKENRLNPKNASDARKLMPGTKKTYLQEYQQTAPPLAGSCITSSYLSVFAMLALFSVSFFGSILIGLIRDGKQSAGLKLAPVLIPVTLGMFMLMSNGMAFFFGLLFGAS